MSLRKKVLIIALCIAVLGAGFGSYLMLINKENSNDQFDEGISSQTESSSQVPNESDLVSSNESSNSSKSNKSSSKSNSEIPLDSSYINERDKYLSWKYSNWQNASESEKIDCADVYANEMGLDRSNVSEMEAIFKSNPNKTLKEIING